MNRRAFLANAFLAVSAQSYEQAALVTGPLSMRSQALHWVEQKSRRRAHGSQ
jgi:hypothetical protein